MGIFTLFKKSLLFISFSLLASAAFAQQFRTKQGGEWEDDSLWEISYDDGYTWDDAYEVPTYGNVEISAGHTITIASLADFDTLKVSAGAILIVEPVAELWFDGGEVYGEVQLNGGIFRSLGSPVVFLSGGYLKVAVTPSTGIPLAVWETGSTCEIVSVTHNVLFQPGVNEFYNLIYNCPSQTIGTYFPHDVTINGSFTINSTGSGTLTLNAGGAERTVIVGGDFVMNNGVFDLDLIGTAQTNLNIGGNFNFVNGQIKRSATTVPSAQSPYLNFIGNTVNINITNGSFSGNVYLAFLTPDAEINLNSSEFKGSGGRLTFISSHRSVLKTSHPDGIMREPAPTIGNIQFGQSVVLPGGLNALTFYYNGTTAQKTGTALQGNVANTKVIIDNPSGVVFNNSSPSGTSITNASSTNLQILQGYLDIGARSYAGTPFGGTGELRTQDVLPAGQTWTGTVTYNGANQNVVAGQYTNLRLTGSGTKTLAGTINVSNTLSVSGTSVNVNNQAVRYNGASQNVLGLAYHELFIEGSGTKTIIAPATVKKTLTINNSTLNTNGNLTLLADASGNANVAPLTGSAAITGNTNVQVFLSGVPTGSVRGTRSLSTPINDPMVVGDKTFVQLKQYVVLLGKAGAINGFDYVSTVNASKSFLDFYNEPNISSAGNFENITNINTVVPQGKGFFVYFVGNRNNIDTKPGKVRTPYLDAEDVTVTYTGPLNTGNISVPVTYTNNGESSDGRFLAGNPYPSTIDWIKVWQESDNIDPTITVVKGGQSNATYNAFSGESLNGGSRYIKTGQGFYVKASSATGGTIYFREDAKELTQNPAVHLMTAKSDRAATLLKSTSANNAIMPSIKSVATSNKLRLQMEKDGMEEELLIVANESSSNNYDLYDSMYIPGMEFGIGAATISDDGVQLAINSITNPSREKEIKLFINSTTGGVSVLRLKELKGFGDYEFLLKDNFTNVTKRISAEGDTYTFNVDKSNRASYGAERLVLSIVPPTTLSIVEKSFVAEKKNEGIELKWSTTRNEEVVSYIVERKVEGDFLEIATYSANSLQFTYLDKNPLGGTNYYRIKTVYKSGEVEHSQVRALNFEIAEKIKVYPNPVQHTLYIDLSNEFSQNIRVNIYNNSGKLVKVETVRGGDICNFDVNGLPSGMYLFNLIDLTTGKILLNDKFIKN